MLTVNGPLLTKQAASLPCEKSGQNPAKTGCRRELSGIRLEAKKSSPHGSESLAKRKEIADLNYWKRIFQTNLRAELVGRGGKQGAFIWKMCKWRITISQAKISTHSTSWQFKTIKLIQRPIKSLYLTPGSKFMVPGSIPTSPNLQWRKLYNISVIWLREVSNRCPFSLEFF